MKSKKKLKSISSLRERAWKYFSLYIRLKNADPDGFCECVTCGKYKHYKEIHAGHYIHGHSKPTFLLEHNVHCQCVRCNHFLSGNLAEYSRFMIDKYGEDKVCELHGLSHKVMKIGREYYEDAIERYKRLSDMEFKKLI